MKRGIYRFPENKKIAEKAQLQQSKKEPKKAVVGNRINDKNDDDYVISIDDSSYMVKQLLNTASPVITPPTNSICFGTPS
jgi:hypothetical protein